VQLSYVEELHIEHTEILFLNVLFETNSAMSCNIFITVSGRNANEYMVSYFAAQLTFLGAHFDDMAMTVLGETSDSDEEETA
jgi:hypothetical protein